MLVPRVGLDLVQVSQVAVSLDRLGDSYMKRIFTPQEIVDCAGGIGLQAARFASRFAAKEATLKALRTGEEGLDLRTIEVKASKGGLVELVLHGAAASLAKSAGWKAWSLSLSHEGDYAAAVVVAQVEE